MLLCVRVQQSWTGDASTSLSRICCISIDFAGPPRIAFRQRQWYLCWALRCTAHSLASSYGTGAHVAWVKPLLHPTPVRLDRTTAWSRMSPSAKRCERKRWATHGPWVVEHSGSATRPKKSARSEENNYGNQLSERLMRLHATARLGNLARLHATLTAWLVSCLDFSLHHNFCTVHRPSHPDQLEQRTLELTLSRPTRPCPP